MDQYEKFEDKIKAKSNIKSNLKSENIESDNKKKLNFKSNVKSGLDQYEKTDHRKMVKIKSKPNVKSVDFNESNIKVKLNGPSAKKKKNDESSKSIHKIRVLRDYNYHLGFDVGTSDTNYNRKSYGSDLKNDYFMNRIKEHDLLDKSDEYVNFQTEININTAEKVKSKSVEKTFKSNMKMRSANKIENTDKIDKFTTHITEGTKIEQHLQEKTKNNSNTPDNNKQKKHLFFKAPPEIKKSEEYNILSNSKSVKSGAKVNPNTSKISNGENSRIHSHKFPLGDRKFF
jgi:hypothetical protein